MFQRLALIGCGLMGGSLALALKRAGQAMPLAVVPGRRPTPTRQ